MNIIKIIREPHFEMAYVYLNDEHIMSGNYWDFHPGCHGMYQYGDFKGVDSLAIAIKKSLNDDVEIEWFECDEEGNLSSLVKN
jgi:hypothetical protein